MVGWEPYFRSMTRFWATAALLEDRRDVSSLPSFRHNYHRLPRNSQHLATRHPLRSRRSQIAIRATWKTMILTVLACGALRKIETDRLASRQSVISYEMATNTCRATRGGLQS